MEKYWGDDGEAPGWRRELHMERKSAAKIVYQNKNFYENKIIHCKFMKKHLQCSYQGAAAQKRIRPNI